MARVPINTFFLFSRRSFAVAAENFRAKPTVTVVTKMANTKGEASSSEEKEVFWMRHPTTGNWIPETHFNEIDVVELREKFISKKKDC